jgi:hypothetical protein
MLAVIGAPNAVPISSADGAVHPRTWKVAVPLPDASEDTVELDPAAAELWLAGVLADVFELVDPPPPQAASMTTASPPNAAIASLERTG